MRELPHDENIYTQGLDIDHDVLYESGGLVGHSTVSSRRWDTLEVIESRALPPDVFAEGLAVDPQQHLVQLTWRDGVAFVWNPSTLAQIGQFSYQGEGWGLTSGDGTLFMTDGSSRITERDPATFEVRQSWDVSRVGGSTSELNELEWSDGVIWANRWGSDEILKIDPRCHTVVAVVDATALRQSARAASTPAGPGAGVLNGIAAVPGTDHLLLTGKNWPVMYEVRVEPAPSG